MTAATATLSRYTTESDGYVVPPADLGSLALEAEIRALSGAQRAWLEAQPELSDALRVLMTFNSGGRLSEKDLEDLDDCDLDDDFVTTEELMGMYDCSPIDALRADERAVNDFARDWSC